MTQRLAQWKQELETWRDLSLGADFETAPDPGFRESLSVDPGGPVSLPLGSIRTIFWDVGGVHSFTNGWDKIAADPRPGSARCRSEVAYEEMHDRANYYWERGLITAEDFFLPKRPSPEPTRSTSPSTRLWPQVCAETKVLHPDCLDLLAALKQSGQWRLATLNNESRELNEYRLDNFKLRSLFDYFICSGYVHEMKPKRWASLRPRIDISGIPGAQRSVHRRQAGKLRRRRELGINTICFESARAASPGIDRGRH